MLLWRKGGCKTGNDVVACERRKAGSVNSISAAFSSWAEVAIKNNITVVLRTSGRYKLAPLVSWVDLHPLDRTHSFCRSLFTRLYLAVLIAFVVASSRRSL